MNEDDLKSVLMYGRTGAKSGDRISLDVVRRWISTPDIEAMGALYSFLNSAQFRRRIDPGVSSAEHREFVLRYFSRCLTEDPTGDWSDSRYQVCRDFVALFRKAWADRSVSREEADHLKAWMEAEYRNGGLDVKTALINGAFEHLFESLDIAEYFGDWRMNEAMADAYARALEWASPPLE